MGPLAVAPSTTWPCWVISMRPAVARRMAATRAGVVRLRHSLGETWRAASEGQIVLPGSRSASSVRMACSKAGSV